MAFRRRRQPPCACGCEQLAQQLAGYEATVAALARAVVMLRPKHANHTIEQGLTGWGVRPDDAARVAAACRLTTRQPEGQHQ